MYKILWFISILIILVLLGSLILISSESNYHYAYIDINGQLGVSARCRNNKCEDFNFNVISVRDYIDIRKK